MKKWIAASAVLGALALAPPALAAAALPPGDYNFNLPGLEGIPVHLADCGFECLTLTAPSGTNVDLHVTRRGDRYEGMVSDPHGAMCHGRPMMADVFYTIKMDGNYGVVQTKGEPCGPSEIVMPLVFNLTARAA